jgi:hypothetical protein
VRIYIKNGEQPEILDGEFVLSDRGVVHVLDLGGGECIVVGAFPPNCTIDARQPSMPDGTAPAGWDRIELTVAGCPASSLGADDFSITATGGTTPAVADVIASGDTVTVVFDRTIPNSAWTCVTLGTTAQCLASMPGDVNGDRTSAPSDILRVVDCLNGVALCDIWQCDLDRSGLCGPPDILRVIDLLNGAGVYEPWLNRSIPACPSAP